MHNAPKRCIPAVIPRDYPETPALTLKLGVTSALIKAGVCAVVRDQTTEGNDRTPGYRNRRLKILGQDEIDEIYGLPRFSDEERELCFALTPSEEAAIIEDLHSTKGS